MNQQPAALKEEIARLAYQIYEEEGRPEGKSYEHWARAERALREQRVKLPIRHEHSEATEQAS